MAKKITAVVKLQLPAGKATPGPPVGSTLGPHGIRSFTFVLKTPPAPVLIKKACGIESGSAVPNKTKVAKLTKEQVKQIATQKMPDLNAASIESAMRMIEGTARSMGVTIVD